MIDLADPHPHYPKENGTMTTPTITRHKTREAWLLAGVAALKPLFEEIGREVPEVRVSVGWPGGRGRKNTVIGQCWHPSTAKDKTANIFISPVLDEPTRVLDVLAHELIHAIDENTSGHRGDFITMARALGLEAPWTATTAGEVLAARLAEIAETLGDYPHGAMTSPTDGVPKQGTRMLKVECAHGSGYKVRLTRKWLDEYGAPFCPCHGEQMEEG